MRFDQSYLRDERHLLRFAGMVALCAGLAAIYLARNLSPPPEPISPQMVWDYIHEVAPQRGIDPEFVYAIAWAESSLNAHARNAGARGMMQVTRPAWREVSDASYRHAWDWKTNIRVAIDYLVFCKAFLQRHDAFNYPLLAACYRFGPYYVKEQAFTMERIREPENKIYQQIFNGVIRPVSAPGM